MIVLCSLTNGVIQIRTFLEHQMYIFWQIGLLAIALHTLAVMMMLAGHLN